jgi:hypothetical protein
VRKSPALASVISDFVVPFLVATAIGALMAAPLVLIEWYIAARSGGGGW